MNFSSSLRRYDFYRCPTLIVTNNLLSQEMLDGIRRRQSFSFDEYQTMLNFQCGVDPSDGEAGTANATDRKYSLYMIDLHGLEIHSSNS